MKTVNEMTAKTPFFSPFNAKTACVGTRLQDVVPSHLLAQPT